MENLKALVYKGDLTPYQRALAQREFEGMVERLEIYEKAVKNNAVLPLVNGWISVKEHKPPSHHVLCYNKHSGIEVSQSINYSFKYVTHWMELPNSPACR